MNWRFSGDDKKDNTDDGYVLTADAGHDLAVLDDSGSVMARAKEVLIPANRNAQRLDWGREEVPQPVDGDAEGYKNRWTQNRAC